MNINPGYQELLDDRPDLSDDAALRGAYADGLLGRPAPGVSTPEWDAHVAGEEERLTGDPHAGRALRARGREVKAGLLATLLVAERWES